MEKFDLGINRNLTMLTDFYEFTMANGYFAAGIKEKTAVFDYFFRRIPDKGGYVIFAGLEQFIQYVKTLEFTQEDIDYLRGKALFSEAFLAYLLDFKFTCDIWAVPEGTPVFPNEPLVTVKGPVIEAQLIETMLLLVLNHQSLIATKAKRITRSAKGKAVVEFGSRRAHGADSAIYGARASFIGGCMGTSCAIADKEMNIPSVGTMGHCWIQIFKNELEAFQTYANAYPNNCALLVDTYNVLKSGVPNAIKIFKEELAPKGYDNFAIRLDSGDLNFLSNKAREMLDKEGLHDCKIIATNSLDEYIIRDLLLQGAKIDIFGVGERLITSKSEPVLGGVYKLVSIQEEDVLVPKIKISENVEKITNPAHKTLYRLYDNETGKAIADVITLADETINDDGAYEIFDSVYTWKRKKVRNFTAKKLMEPIFEKGVCVYQSPELSQIRDYCEQQINSLWDDILRLENPGRYFVDLSEKLWELKNQLLKTHACD